MMSLKHQLIRGSSVALLMRVGAVLASLTLSVALARVLGPEQYGTYAFVLSLVAVLSMPVQLGLPTLLLRETAQANVLEDWSRLKSIWIWSARVAVLASLTLLTFTAFLLWQFPSLLEPNQRSIMLIALMLIPLLTFLELINAALRGLRRIFLSLLPGAVLRPLLLAIAVLVLANISDTALAAQTAIILHSGIAALTVLLAIFWLLKSNPVKNWPRHATHFEHREWLSSILPLSLMTGLQLINQNTDLIMLGAFKSSIEVGHYRVASSVATLAVFGLTIVDLVLQPHFAEFFARKEMLRLQRVASLGALVSLVLTLPVILFLWLLGQPIINLFFGTDYLPAYAPLMILMLGRTVSAFFGPVGALLSMSGNARYSLVGLSMSAVINIALNAILIPHFGVVGAASATAISIAVWSSVYWFSAFRIIGIDSSPFAFFKRQTDKS